VYLKNYEAQSDVPPANQHLKKKKDAHSQMSEIQMLTETVQKNVLPQRAHANRRNGLGDNNQAANVFSQQ